MIAVFSSLSLFTIYQLQSRSIYFILLRSYIAVEFLLLVFFLTSLVNNNLYKKLFLISMPLFLIFCFFNFITTDSKIFNIYPSLIEFSLLIFFLILYFFEKMRIVSNIPLFSTISFWLCVGLFIYFTGNLFYLLFITSTKDAKLQIQMQTIYSCVTITKNIILAAAWFANEKLQTESDIIQLPENMKLDDDFSFTNTTNS